QGPAASLLERRTAGGGALARHARHARQGHRNLHRPRRRNTGPRATGVLAGAPGGISRVYRGRSPLHLPPRRVPERTALGGVRWPAGAAGRDRPGRPVAHHRDGHCRRRCHQGAPSGGRRGRRRRRGRRQRGGSGGCDGNGAAVFRHRRIYERPLFVLRPCRARASVGNPGRGGGGGGGQSGVAGREQAHPGGRAARRRLAGGGSRRGEKRRRKGREKPTGHRRSIREPAGRNGGGGGGDGFGGGGQCGSDGSGVVRILHRRRLRDHFQLRTSIVGRVCPRPQPCIALISKARIR
ncbi:unnamed protein product, partial [Phaeothamnion confervicola]